MQACTAEDDCQTSILIFLVESVRFDIEPHFASTITELNLKCPSIWLIITVGLKKILSEG